MYLELLRYPEYSVTLTPYHTYIFNKSILLHIDVSKNLDKWQTVYSLISSIWPGGYKTFFMLNSAEHEVCQASKSQISNICKFFLAKQS